MGPKLTVLGGLDRENCECQSSDPLENQTTPKHVIQWKKYGDTPKKMCSPELRKKSYKKQRKKERKKERKKKEPIFEHYISPLHRAGPARPTFTIFGMWGATADVIIRAKF